MLIGGAEDKVRDKLILSRFATFAGGPDGHVAVIATASSLGDVATERYRELFEGLGIGRVTGLRPEERSEAEDPALAAALTMRPRSSSRAGTSSACPRSSPAPASPTRSTGPTTAAPCSRGHPPARARWRRT